MKLAEVIQQLQQRVMELELQTIPSTPQEVRDQREMNAQSTVERIKALTEECKQLSSRSAQIYENLTENPELHKLESNSRRQSTSRKVQVQLKALSPIERMKRSQNNAHPTTDSYHPEQGNGSHSTTSTCRIRHVNYFED
jgi:hypothetical protein